MRSKISKKILSETSQETKDKVNDYANKLVLSGVVKSFTAEEVGDMLANKFTTIEEAIAFFDSKK